MDIITNSDSKKLNRAARPANGGVLNRGFDAAIDFIDERFEDIARLIGACRHAAAWLWGSKLYVPLCFLVQAGFMAVGQPIAGGILTMSMLIFMLLFCEDLMSVLFPLVLLTLLSTEFYSGLYDLLQFWWIGVLAAAALLIHVGAYAKAPRNGGCMHSLVAVSVATLVGGLGYISAEEYLSPTALYYSLGLGAVMLLVYVLARSEVGRARDYDVAERLMQTLYAAGLFTGFVVLLFYARNLPEFLESFSTIYFSYRNFCATMLLMALPSAAYFTVRNKRHFASMVFLYLMLLMTGSRSGLIFGSVMLALGLGYVYYCDTANRPLYRRVLAIGAVPVIAVLIVMVHALFASRMVDGELISIEDSRVTFFVQGLRDFVANPLFGCGLGSMHNSKIFLGVEGSIVWYHNLFAQILGSMGLVGAVAYGWMFLERVSLLWHKRSKKTLALALVYLAMLLISMTNPGEFCPLPNALLMVVLFVVMEEQPEHAAAPA